MNFETLRDRTLEELHRRGAVERPLDAQYATQLVRDTTLTTRCLELPDRGEARLVSIEGKKVHILNAFLWPRPEVQAPVYAMEFVAFGPKPIVAVIDAVGLAGDASVQLARELLAEAHARFPFTAGDDLPAWFQSCRSGHEFFVRPQRVEDFAALGEAHLFAWARALDALRIAPLIRDSTHEIQLKSYKSHHANSSPGLKWLQVSFGEAWTDTYLHRIVFG